jgi:hypothetical protein
VTLTDQPGPTPDNPRAASQTHRNEQSAAG